jgi:hypothetical protein
MAAAVPVNSRTNAAGAMTDAAGNVLTLERFIRFSHGDSVNFFGVFNGLNAVPPAGAPLGTLSEQDQFRALVGQLLNNITIPAVPGPGGAAAHLCTIADLPRIQ